MTEKKDLDQPYLFVTSNLPMTGLPMAGDNDVVHLFARGFKYDLKSKNLCSIVLDGQVIQQSAKIKKDNTISFEFRVPKSLSFGEHIVQVIQKADNEDIVARSRFVKVPKDDFEIDRK